MSTIKAGVIGYPISHSKSPLIHNHWLDRYGIAGDYSAIEVAPENLESDIARLAGAGFAGFNVTIPHKQAVMPLCATLDPTARAIGAVNTIVIRDGALHGMNTDAFGFLENLQKSSFGADFIHRPAVVLGAGGAARAVVHALLNAGAGRILLTNRTMGKIGDIVAMAPDVIEPVAWDDKNAALTGAGLLVNTTSLGMTGQPELEIDLSLLPQDAVVCDIVYAPLMTAFLQQAETRGNQIVTGIGMLLHQARPAFEQWFGILPEIDEDLERRVLGLQNA